MPQEYIYSKKFQEGVHFEQESQFAEPPHSLKDAVDPDHLVRLSQLGALGGGVAEYANSNAFPAIGEAGKIYLNKETNLIYRWDGTSYVLIGDGIKISALDNNEIIQLPDGLFVPPSLQNGLISGGQVTWKTGYTYSVQAAIYKINGIIYTSPYTEITLAASDLALNRIDVFAVTSTGAAVAVTGIPSVNPEQPAINTGTQLQVSFAIVVAGSVSPVPDVSKEFIYAENAGTPTEWVAVASAPDRFGSDFNENPYLGLKAIRVFGAKNNDKITFTRSAPFSPLSASTTLSYWSKVIIPAPWLAAGGGGVKFSFQFKNGGLNVGLSRERFVYPFGFDPYNDQYQKIVLNLEEFGFNSNDVVDRLEMSVKGVIGGMEPWLYIDNIELQGTNVVSNNVATTDNTGVFYVSKNYSGIGAAVVTGYTLTSITSPNAGYNVQLASARMGDANKAFPDPWSARNAAMQAMAAGTITKALVVMNGGNTWTFGSSNSAQNGSEAGVSATATVADVGFSSGQRDIQSLLKNKIDYYFNPNAGLTNICKSFQVFVGWHLDITDTAYKSGIYGYGNFTTIYGTLEGLSTRFIDIDNANAEVTFEANNCVFQRACLTMQNYKNFSVKIKKWVGGLRDTVLYERGSDREGDGSPSNLIVNIETVLSGTSFFPYPIAAVDTASALFEFAGTTGLATTRQKNKTYNIDKLHHISNGKSAQLLKGQGSDSVPAVNVSLIMNIGYYKQILDPTILTNTVGGLIGIFYTNGSALRQNTSWVFNINKADIEHALLDGRNGFTQDAASINNSVILNIGYIRKKVVTAGTSMNDSIFCLPATVYVTAGEKPTYIFNIGEAIADNGYVFSNQGYAGYTYNATVIIKGVFKAKSALPVINLLATGSSAFLQDATLITPHTASIDGDAAGKLIYCKDTLSNVSANAANVTVQGVLIVDANITNYLL